MRASGKRFDFMAGDAMRYVQINSHGDRWADSIIFKKHYELQAAGHESWVFWARGEHEQDEYMQKIARQVEVCVDAVQTRLDGRPGFYSKGITRRLLKKLDEINPDVVHLHVLLGYYINIEMLFEWLAKSSCQVIWTLHDCWALTGHCIYFTFAGCEQWKTGCGCMEKCPQPNAYPETFRKGMEGWNYKKKKELITRIPTSRLTLQTPSEWLAELVRQSYLSEYTVQVVNNTIDSDVYRPTPSDIRSRLGVGDKFMILGVASKWSERKGLDDFLKLSTLLDGTNFSVVLVGLNDQQIQALPKGVIGLKKTSSPRELAEIYTAADVFFNPTLEDNYPTVNLEAEACGTPVVTYDTGGCAETVALNASVVVEAGDTQQAACAIYNLRNGIV